MKWIVGLLAQASGETTPIDFSFSPSTTWRLVNDAEVTYGWSISELRTFSDPNCQEPAAPARAEGASALGASASRALDGSTLTEWRAPCHICGLHEAWLTLHFDAPVALMCLELFQWGDRDYAAAAVLLQRKSGPGTEEWVTVLRGHQLQGGRWDALHFVQCAPLAAPNYGSVRLTNNGLYPSEATFTCKGIRPLTGSGTSVCGSDGQWSDTPPTCWEAIHFIAVISAVLAIDASAFVIYYRCYVVDQPKPLNDESIIPQDYLGKWNSELLGDFTAEPKLMTVTVLCPCCRIAHTWQQAGRVAFQLAICVPHLFFCCLPCIGTYFRNSLRQRFSIRRRSSTLLDCCAWTFLPCCAAVQEAKMVDAMCVVAYEEGRVKDAVEQRKAEAFAKAKATTAVSARAAQVAGAAPVKLGLSSKTGALRKPKSSLEMIATTPAAA
ncbi:Hypothetical protein (Fragment) [Durusdinium trenchii]|uniref:Sushi domain-containing protein n=1 Tax=Durusdinium trenchii TaxID=1381693 RepID=A0ABP0SE90_9DINO